MFLADVGERPTPLHSIDRIDNDSSYTCGKCDDCIAHGFHANCRWATKKEQANNRRCTRLVQAFGSMIPIGVLADAFNLPVNTLGQRIFAYGWPLERALITPIMGQKHGAA